MDTLLPNRAGDAERRIARAKRDTLLGLGAWIEDTFKLAESPKIHAHTEAAQVYVEILRRINELQAQ